MDGVRQAAGRFCAVRVGAAPTCAFFANGAPDVFFVLRAKVKKKKRSRDAICGKAEHARY
jgi:hypothetical protein